VAKVGLQVVTSEAIYDEYDVPARFLELEAVYWL
jgi:hypothetical protein